MPFGTFPSNVPSIPETKGQSTFNDKIIEEQQSIHGCDQEIPPGPKKSIATAKRKKKNEEDAKNDSQLEKVTNLLSNADKCFHSSDFKGALIKYKELLPYAKEVLSHNSPTIGDIYVKISVIQEGADDFDGALQSLIQALEAYNKVPAGRQQIKIINTLNSIANLYVLLKDINEATKCYKDVVEVSKRAFGSDNYKVAMSLINLGNFLSGCAHNHSEAILVFTEALRIQHKGANGHMNTTFASTLNHMGKAYVLRSRSGDLDRAEKCYLQAAKVFRYSMIPSDDQAVINVLCNLYHVRELRRKKGVSRNNKSDKQLKSIIQSNEILEKISEESRDDDDKQIPQAPYTIWASFCFSAS